MGSTNGEGSNGSQATYAEKASAPPAHTDAKGAARTTLPLQLVCPAPITSQLRMLRRLVESLGFLSCRSWSLRMVPAHRQLRPATLECVVKLVMYEQITLCRSSRGCAGSSREEGLKA